MINAISKSKIGEDVCLQLSLPNHKYFYLCDCGQASDLTIADVKNLNGLFMSHTHIDHFYNFDMLLRHQLPVTRQIVICGPKGIAKNVQAKLLAYNWDILLTEEQAANALSYQIREITEKGIFLYELHTPQWKLERKGKLKNEYLYENEVFKVKYAILNHNTPSIAYSFIEHSKISMKENCPLKAGEWIKLLKKAFQEKNNQQIINIGNESFEAKDLFQYLEEKQGFQVSFVMDHLACEENHQKIIQLCKNTDELYIEAYYLSEEIDLAIKNHHSTAFISGKIAKEAGAKKAFPIHFSRRHQSPENLKILLQEFEKGFSV
ncbi:MAG: peptidase [Cytophagia bacterium]|nr:MAG: peptidase [Cytophagia bacterium]TAG42758.1 MAG: peptidase [Cytophagia bacterium]TAH29724.1 MAG: peptidase [Cytophagales bacterium]